MSTAGELFKTTLMGGYDKDEVAEGLTKLKDEAYAEKTKLLGIIRERDRKLEELTNRLEQKETEIDELHREIREKYQPYIDNYESIARLVYDAQLRANAIEKETEERSGRMMQEAQEESGRMMQEAREESSHMMQEAQEESGRMMQEAREESGRMTQEAQEESGRMMQEAREESEHMTQEAREESERMMQEAREESERMTQEAREESERTMQEAQEKSHLLLEKARKMAEDCMDTVQSEVDAYVTEGRRKYLAIQEELNGMLELMNQVQHRFMESCRAVHSLVGEEAAGIPDTQPLPGGGGEPENSDEEDVIGRVSAEKVSGEDLDECFDEEDEFDEEELESRIKRYLEENG